MTGAEPQPAAQRLRTDTATKLSADAVALGLSTLNGVVAARALGPEGKGTLSTLLFLTGLFSTMAVLGVGEAAVVQVGRNAIARVSATRTSLLLCLILGVTCAALFLGIATMIVGGSGIEPHLLLAASIPCSVLLGLTSQLLLIGDWVGVASKLTVLLIGLTAVGYLLFVVILGGGVTGAATATLAAASLTLIAAFAALSRRGLRPGFGWNRAFVRFALRYGATVQAAYVAGALSARGDLALVYAFDGAEMAGQYSIALTVGALAGLVPWAVSYVTFAPVARMTSDARESVVRLARRATAAAIIVAAALAICSPALVPLIFGPAYAPAVVPSIILALNTILLTTQLMVTRGLAARGEPRALLLSYAASTIAMTVSDLALIPLLHGTGAALGSVIGAVVGVGTALAVASRSAVFGHTGVGPAELVPTWTDIRDVLYEISSLGRRILRRTVRLR